MTSARPSSAAGPPAGRSGTSAPTRAAPAMARTAAVTPNGVPSASERRAMPPPSGIASPRKASRLTAAWARRPAARAVQAPSAASPKLSAGLGHCPAPRT